MPTGRSFRGPCNGTARAIVMHFAPLTKCAPHRGQCDRQNRTGHLRGNTPHGDTDENCEKVEGATAGQGETEGEQSPEPQPHQAIGHGADRPRLERGDLLLVLLGCEWVTTPSFCLEAVHHLVEDHGGGNTAERNLQEEMGITGERPWN